MYLARPVIEFDEGEDGLNKHFQRANNKNDIIWVTGTGFDGEYAWKRSDWENGAKEDFFCGGLIGGRKMARACDSLGNDESGG